MTNLLGYLSIIISVIANIRYLRSLFRGETKPHAFSRFIRAIMTGTAFFAQRTQTHELGTRVMGISAAMCLFIAWYGRWRYKVVIEKIDWLYFLCALLGIGAWYITNTPLRSVVIVSVTDALAFLPTFRKVRSDPYGESVWVYGLSALKFVFALRSFESFSLVVRLYPMYLIVANTTFVIYTLWRRWCIEKIH